ncbi:glutaredoxin [Bacillus pakistanensis]|uniref:Glutaredoxin n=1 Tax=Rossellomorea pakistanensis TaxID=992288 RepID=A0ABS2NFL2_9BACI|nr:glutaredoxin domain-containing protein [Bacillus pakistanensis]MBM7586641.1 glutaredoxin [Bacillus pakistanensis]
MEILLYTQPDCPPCLYIKNLLHHHKINYKEFNIQSDSRAKKELIEKYQSFSTPTVVIDGKVFIGQDIERIKEIIEDSMK